MRISLCIIIILIIFVPGIFADMQGPYIMPSSPERESTKVRIRWLTDISSNSQVEYGEDRDNLEFKVIRTEFVINHKVELSGLKPDTRYYYRITSTDSEGNSASSDILELWTDVTPPNIEILNLVDRAIVSGNVNIIYNVSDNIGVQYVQLYIDYTAEGTIDRTEPYEIIWDTTRYKDGPHKIYAMAVDIAGNVNPITVEVTVDNIPNDTPPVVRIVSPVDGQVVSGDVKIAVEATDDMEIRRVDCLIDGESSPLSDWPPYEWEWQTSFYEPGEYTLQATAKDSDGNIGRSQSIRVKVVAPGTDITPPVTQDNYQFNNIWTNQDANITLTATDDITGVKETHYTINGTEYTGTGIIIIQEGIHTVQYWSIDLAGNIESKHTITVKIDKTPPTVSIYTDPAEYIWPPDNKTVTVTVRGSATDELSGVSSKVFTVTDEYNEISPSLGDFNQAIELLAARRGDDLDGRVYTIKVDVKDNAGNSASGQTTVIVPHDRRK